MRVWTGSLCFRMGTGSTLLWMRWWTCRFHEQRRISWVAQDLLASQWRTLFHGVSISVSGFDVWTKAQSSCNVQQVAASPGQRGTWMGVQELRRWEVGRVGVGGHRFTNDDRIPQVNTEPPLNNAIKVHFMWTSLNSQKICHNTVTSTVVPTAQLF